jgi:hypothetical protein
MTARGEPGDILCAPFESREHTGKMPKAMNT